MFKINTDFIGSFKVGDNICYNISILKLLYKQYSKADENDQALLRKPIIITLVSITEAILYDLHFKIVNFTSEGVGDIPKKTLTSIRSKKIKDFDKLITCVRKHNLYDRKTTGLYDKLDELRRLRNRIHIQNTKGEFETDEIEAFSEAKKILAEKALEKILKITAEKFSRGSSFNFVPDFILPWKEHFK